MKHVSLLLFFWVFSQIIAFGQQSTRRDSLPNKNPNGGWARIEVVDGDTIYVAVLRTVAIRGQRIFATQDDQKRYTYYKRCAAKVYPYAVEAVKLYNEMQVETADMNRRERKKFAKRSQKDLEGDYEDQLKHLTKTQGQVLIKMIERYTQQPFFSIVKQTRGGVTAMYWNGLGKIWGYDLKDGYEIGKDPVLDAVLQDFDLSMSIGE